MEASWEVVAGLRCVEAARSQAEAAGRRRVLLPVGGHRCVLTVERLDVRGHTHTHTHTHTHVIRSLEVSRTQNTSHHSGARGGSAEVRLQTSERTSPIRASSSSSSSSSSSFWDVLIMPEADEENGSYCCVSHRHERRLSCEETTPPAPGR